MTEEQFDDMLANVLRIGVAVAAILIACGGAVFLSRHGFELPEYHAFRGEPGNLGTLTGIVSEAARFSGRGLIQLGLLCLIATPIGRVVVSIIGFLKVGDRLYTAITLLVLMLLVYSITSG